MNSGMSRLTAFAEPVRALVVGASGGIGRAIIAHLLADENTARVTAWTRSPEKLAISHPKLSVRQIDLMRETTIADAAADLDQPNLIVVTTGLLHDAHTQPEKSWRALDAATLTHLFAVNTIGPALVAKHTLPLLPRDQRAVFAALSARVGSISDNRLGGWYGYRASKSALNQILRTLSIELATKRPHAICVGLHPGTVDTGLSKPFQSQVSEGKLFTPDQSAAHLLAVIDTLSPAHTGRVFAWDGAEVPA
jgi:NAD(P)-dependent dehydrogenase (short-subunit alcohol dehydrogenase family)